MAQRFLHATESLAGKARRLLACLRHPAKPDTVGLKRQLLVAAVRQGLNMVALRHIEGVAVDA